MDAIVQRHAVLCLARALGAAALLLHFAHAGAAGAEGGAGGAGGAGRPLPLSPPVLAVIFIATLGTAPVMVNLKPEMFSVALTCLVFWAYFNGKRADREGASAAPWFAAVPLTMLLWVNSHGGFVLILPVLAAIGAGELINRAIGTRAALSMRALRALLLAWTATGLAIFATPYGTAYPGQLLAEALGRAPCRAWPTSGIRRTSACGPVRRGQHARRAVRADGRDPARAVRADAFMADHASAWRVLEQLAGPLAHGIAPARLKAALAYREGIVAAQAGRHADARLALERALAGRVASERDRTLMLLLRAVDVPGLPATERARLQAGIERLVLAR